VTLVHGDLRGDNILFDQENNLFLIDFQITGVANGLYDIAFFVCQSIDSDIRRGNDESLIRLYVDTLAAEGIVYPFDEAMRVYRLAIAFCLVYAVTSYQAYEAFDGRRHELMSSSVSRAVRAIVDNDSLSLIP
jgi:thiamine kinase-like enzyme